MFVSLETWRPVSLTWGLRIPLLPHPRRSCVGFPEESLGSERLVDGVPEEVLIPRHLR